MKRLRTWWRSRQVDLVSAAWLKEQARKDSRVEFHSVLWRWPLNKVVQEHAKFQTQRCRKVA